jgi:hypothetical protein
MFDYGLDRGIDVGIGGGWRSSAQQEAVFRERYAVVSCSTAGSIAWNGQCWKLKPGMAPSAPPGRSYHETTPPNDGAIAADLIGNIVWADQVAFMFGLRSLANLPSPNNELWHHQPIEVATARRNYDGYAIQPFPLPEDPPPPPPSGRIIDMYGISYKLDRWPGPHLDRVGLDSIEHVQDGDAWQIDLATFPDGAPGMPVKTLDREQYKAMLRDRGRRHVSIDENGYNTQDPFDPNYAGGEFADIELSDLWRRQQR